MCTIYLVFSSGVFFIFVGFLNPYIITQDALSVNTIDITSVGESILQRRLICL